MLENIGLFQNVLPALPEILLAVGSMILLMIGVFGGDRYYAIVTAMGIGLAVVVAAALILLIPDGKIFLETFIFDGFARFMKVLTLLGTILVLILSWAYRGSENIQRFEFPILILLATLGMLMMISANDLIALYLGIELQSLSLYVVAAINRDSLKSTEAGLKYFVLGALSSGMLLYGMSLLYGFSGHTGFAEIAEAISRSEQTLGLTVGLVFVLAGICFKISVVPFHMWTPDVYEGAPTPVTAFFAAAPKVAAMAMLTRLIITAFEPVTNEWQQIIVFVSIASMILGAFAAIGQTNIKRLLAYSSIGHMGYALIGLATGSTSGVEAVIIYMVVYMLSTIGAFAWVMSMNRREGIVEDIEELSGLSRTHPVMAMFLLLIMFSFAGIPPLAGFFAKLYVFWAAIEAQMVALAIVGAVTSVVSAFYYIRVIKLMYSDNPRDSFSPLPSGTKAILGASGIFVIAFIFVADSLSDLADTAARTLF